MGTSTESTIKRRVSPERAQKKETTRLRLLEVSARIIGKYGYAGCSIARITARAKVAHGAFYLHFKSQQELFDQILPTLGGGMLDAISVAVRGSRDILDLERRGLEANFAYLAKHPYMHRVMNEAELHAPRAHRQYVDSMIERYRRALSHGRRVGQFTNFEDGELECVATMLVGMRVLLLRRFCVEGLTIRTLPPELIETYLRFVAHGLGVPMANGAAHGD